MISIDYNDFFDKIDNYIEKGFNEKGLGLIVINNVPELKEKRKNLLTSIKQFAEMPDTIKEKYVDEKSLYSFGWSHGKEKMSNGIADIAKGSYYANPLKDIITQDKNLKEQFPEIYSDNIWPDELPELKENFNNTTEILIKIGLQFCIHLDNFLTTKTNGKHDNQFFDIISKSITHKGRMLHYFPNNSNQIDGLCGWHLDHGCITMLVSPLYFSSNSNENIDAPVDCGLYIKGDDNKNIKITIPEDSVVIQLGEMFQYLSGGFLYATPHCVKSGINSNISREQLALFMDCSPELLLKLPSYSKSIKEVVTCKNLPEGVPTLESRIIGTKMYKDFVTNTLKAYYN